MTTKTHSPLAETAIAAGKKLANEAYRVNGAAEGKAAAIYNYGNYTMGYMSSDELAELIENAERAALHPSRQESRDFGKAYLTTMYTLITL